MRALRALVSGVILLGVLAGCAQTPAPGRTDEPAPPTASVPADVSMYVIGDSWSSGFMADPARTAPIVAAATLGWGVTMNAVGGTGYVVVHRPHTSSFPQRAARIPTGQSAQVVLLQGSTNDETAPTAKAIGTTVALLRIRFPHATVVMLGPGLRTVADGAHVGELDSAMSKKAAALGVPYISMIRRGWISSTNLAYVIDPTTSHPTVAGDAYLGGRLADALLGLKIPGTVAKGSSS